MVMYNTCTTIVVVVIDFRSFFCILARYLFGSCLNCCAVCVWIFFVLLCIFFFTLTWKKNFLATRTKYKVLATRTYVYSKHITTRTIILFINIYTYTRNFVLPRYIQWTHTQWTSCFAQTTTTTNFQYRFSFHATKIITFRWCTITYSSCAFSSSTGWWHRRWCNRWRSGKRRERKIGEIATAPTLCHNNHSSQSITQNAKNVHEKNF